MVLTFFSFIKFQEQRWAHHLVIYILFIIIFISRLNWFWSITDILLNPRIQKHFSIFSRIQLSRYVLQHLLKDPTIQVCTSASSQRSNYPGMCFSIFSKIQLSRYVLQKYKPPTQIFNIFVWKHLLNEFIKIEELFEYINWNIEYHPDVGQDLILILKSRFLISKFFS